VCIHACSRCKGSTTGVAVAHCKKNKNKKTLKNKEKTQNTPPYTPPKKKKSKKTQKRRIGFDSLGKVYATFHLHYLRDRR